MNSQIKQAWTEALLSGNYDQTKARLYDGDNGFCCLGVLCDLYLKEKNLEWESKHTIFGQYEYLPESVMKWAELDNDNPKVNGEFLSELNDGGKPFSEIAKLIEEHL